MNPFARKLRSALNSHGISQKDLADKLHRQRSRVNQYLNTEDVPPRDVVEKIADIFGEERAEWLEVRDTVRYKMLAPEAKQFNVLAMEQIVEYAATTIAAISSIKGKEVSVMPYLTLNDLYADDHQAFITDNPKRTMVDASHLICMAIPSGQTPDPDKFCLFIPGTGSPQVMLYDKDLQTKGKCYIILGAYKDFYQ